MKSVPAKFAPEFNDEGLLPWINNEKNVSGCIFNNSSPYYIPIEVLISKFCYNKERIRLVKSLIYLRSELRVAGYRTGIQWIGGSFTEHVEQREGRPPNDLDIMSLVDWPKHIKNGRDYIRFKTNNPNIHNREYWKKGFSLDHFMSELNPDRAMMPSMQFLAMITGWFSLYSNQSQTNKRKGFLAIPFETYDDDHEANELLDIISNKNFN